MLLDPEIVKLKEECLTMCSATLANLRRAIAFYESDETPASFKPIEDDPIDNMERNLEEKCLSTLLHEHPFASNLREVAGILKAVEDIERIADHAEDLSTWTIKLKKAKGKREEMIIAMMNVAEKMVDEAFLSVARDDEATAQNVIKMDDDQDKLYDSSIASLIALGNSGSRTEEEIVYSTILAKYLERISDHAVNVAEWVIFMIKGYHKDRQIF